MMTPTITRHTIAIRNSATLKFFEIFNACKILKIFKELFNILWTAIICRVIVGVVVVKSATFDHFEPRTWKWSNGALLLVDYMHHSYSNNNCYVLKLYNCKHSIHFVSKFQVLATSKWSKVALFTTMTPTITRHTIAVHNMASNSLKISEISQTLKMTDTETDIQNTKNNIIPHSRCLKEITYYCLKKTVDSCHGIWHFC